MTVNHTWDPFTDLSRTPSHSAAIRDYLLPTIRGRLEVQPYATTAALPAAGDFIGQQAYTSDYGVLWSWSGTAWRVVGTPVFASTTARDAAIPSPVEGDQCQTLDYGVMWRHDGTGWCVVGTPVFDNAAARVAAVPSPRIGDRCYLADTKTENACVVAGTWIMWARATTTYAPTITGQTSGSPTIVGGNYAVSNGRCHGSLVATFTGAVNATIVVPLPIAATNFAAWESLGDMTLLKGGTRIPGILIAPSAGASSGYVASATTAITLASATSPFTWASGDQITVNFDYPVA